MMKSDKKERLLPSGAGAEDSDYGTGSGALRTPDHDTQFTPRTPVRHTQLTIRRDDIESGREHKSDDGTYAHLPGDEEASHSTASASHVGAPSQPGFARTTQQHHLHQLALDPGKNLHRKVTNYHYNTLNNNSRFQGGRFPFLSPLSHNHSRRSLAVTIPTFIIILGFAGLITEAWHTGLDDSHMNDGAPTSGGQSHADGVAATRGAALSYTSLAAMIIGAAALLWHFVDKKTYMQGYKNWCQISEVPDFDRVEQSTFFTELKSHTHFLLRSYDGTSGLGYMLSDLNRHIGPPTIEIRLDDTPPPPPRHSPPASPPHTPVSCDGAGTASESRDTKGETAARDQLLIDQADAQNRAQDIAATTADRSEQIAQGRAGIINRGALFIRGLRARPEILHIETFRNELDPTDRATLGRSSSSGEMPILRIPDDRQTEPCNFAAVWMLEIRNQMSHLGINTSSNNRANFLKALINGHSGDDQHALLTPLISTYFLFYTTHANDAGRLSEEEQQRAKTAFSDEHRKDIRTFMGLTSEHRTITLECLCRYTDINDLVNELLDALPLTELKSKVEHLSTLNYTGRINEEIYQKLQPSLTDEEQARIIGAPRHAALQ